jgi:hypothetical protein
MTDGAAVAVDDRIFETSSVKNAAVRYMVNRWRQIVLPKLHALLIIVQPAGTQVIISRLIGRVLVQCLDQGDSNQLHAVSPLLYGCRLVTLGPGIIHSDWHAICPRTATDRTSKGNAMTANQLIICVDQDPIVVLINDGRTRCHVRTADTLH